MGEILKQLCKYKGVEIIEGHLMPDHVHMLVSRASSTTFKPFKKGSLKGNLI